MQGNDSDWHATSILDYVFRELAVSYMSCLDLAHVDPSESNFDAMGKGVEEGKAPDAAHSSKFVSKGITRSRTDRLVVMQGGSPAASQEQGTKSDGPRMAYSSPESRSESPIGSATALKIEPEHQLSPADKLETLNWSKAGTAQLAPTKAERRAEAKAKGYEGEMRRVWTFFFSEKRHMYEM